MTRIQIITTVLFLGFFCFDCKKETSNKKGFVGFVSGTVHIQRDGKSIKPEVNQEIIGGDVIVTGDKSIATVVFGENSTVLEIQSNSKFHFNEIANDKTFFQESGASWIVSNKLLKGEGITLQTPSTTAGVRGTKFYTTVYEDMIFTCHCEGKIELENKTDKSKRTNEQDYLSVTRGNKTIYITPADSQKEGISYNHNHSEIQNSPLGPQNQMSKEEFGMLIAIVKKKLDSP
ncbi:iron dicitrate transport regulator FecR [Leptospira fletcheri]|uniref:Iron dicitrate transport regulator FecR n=1 Tax=Leptospira fletcheri TaxID=2484981 RepID=A0A4R9GE95_9LEPT|nr:FecR domain-containing protein [Leptospira fletcheri]TGK10158.1 iron dicitrate transport regulator FecR [Leptospira fletcheri]